MVCRLLEQARSFIHFLFGQVLLCILILILCQWNPPVLPDLVVLPLHRQLLSPLNEFFCQSLPWENSQAIWYFVGFPVISCSVKTKTSGSLLWLLCSVLLKSVCFFGLVLYVLNFYVCGCSEIDVFIVVHFSTSLLLMKWLKNYYFECLYVLVYQDDFMMSNVLIRCRFILC